MKTLVFGGGGFVGLNIAEHLLARGEEVTVFDTAPLGAAVRSAFASLPGTLREVAGDVRDPATLPPAFEDHPDAVIFGAAITAGIERDRDAPERTMEVNLIGFLNALRAARDAGSGRIINLSSGGAYGRAAFIGGELDEEKTGADPHNIYSLTKYGSERIGMRMGEVWGLDVVSVRLSAVFGRWERQTSVRDTPSPQLQILQAARAGQEALIERRDLRDWIYAPDVALAVRLLRDAAKLSHPLYNVSTGSRWSVADWGAAFAAAWPGFVCRVAGPGETANIELHAPQDRAPMRIDRLTGDTGFAPAFDLQRSVADLVDWSRGIGAAYP